MYEGLVYGLFVHGAICNKEDLAYCEDCVIFHSRHRWLCPNCRDDREIEGTTLKTCLMGYCPTRETQTSNECGMGCKKDLAWQRHGHYDPSIVPEEKRIEDFKMYHLDPQGIIARLRRSIPLACVGRDMQAMTPGVAYGENTGFRPQFNNWLLTLEDFRQREM